MNLDLILGLLIPGMFCFGLVIVFLNVLARKTAEAIHRRFGIESHDRFILGMRIAIVMSILSIFVAYLLLPKGDGQKGMYCLAYIGVSLLFMIYVGAMITKLERMD